MNTTHTHSLPDDPVYAFAPSYDFPDKHQRIRIVFQGMDGYVPTALVALNLEDAEQLCDRLNAKLGLDRDAWSKLVAHAMRSSNEQANHH